MLSLAIAWLLASPVLADPEPAGRCQHFTPQRQAFFGDLHVHTKYSLDAGTQGTRTTPDQAYAFAKGDVLGVQPWINQQAARELRLARPLDFAMVADHAELFGEISLCSNPATQAYDAWQCDMYRDWPRAAYYWFNYWASQQAVRLTFCGIGGERCLRAAGGPWGEIQAAAARHLDNTDQCSFTTFVGYEWTGGAAAGGWGNVHRNLVFRSARVPDLPTSFIEQPTADGLYRALNDQCNQAGNGCQVLAIPHNSNLSAGLMFRPPANTQQAQRQVQFERLAEIIQHKGSSECYFNPLGGSDELCAFEQLPRRSFTDNSEPGPKDGFLRRVLSEGLALQSAAQPNPYQFGFIGSSDTHLGAAGAVEEGQFIGHGGAGLPPPAAGALVGLPDYPEYNPGGLAVLWAEENRRDSLFDAMLRREAYATSGPRIQARFFAAWDFPETICDTQGDTMDLVAQGYAQGVPMGGTLTPKTASAAALAPVFVVQALQDSHSLGLDRLQIIKGWVDPSGTVQEQVFDIAVTDSPGQVDPQTCATTGRSSPQLCARWRDSTFDQQQPAYYYARILEAPSCRWSQRQCVAAGVNCANRDTVTEGYAGCCNESHQPVIQERAWTSPIWYESTR